MQSGASNTRTDLIQLKKLIAFVEAASKRTVFSDVVHLPSSRMPSNVKDVKIPFWPTTDLCLTS